MKRLLIFLLLLLSPAALTGNEESTEPGDKSQENKARLHAISSERLRVIMQNINLWLNEVSESENVRPQSDEKRMQDLADLVDAVQELQLHAELLSEGLPGSSLTESELVTFRAMAQQLATETQDFQQIANSYEYTLIEPAYALLNQTCIACHRLFRDKSPNIPSD